MVRFWEKNNKKKKVSITCSNAQKNGAHHHEDLVSVSFKAQACEMKTLHGPLSHKVTICDAVFAALLLFLTLNKSS